jgi:hypothetical protein
VPSAASSGFQAVEPKVSGDVFTATLDPHRVMRCGSA